MGASSGGCKTEGLDRSALQARQGQKVDSQGTDGNNEGADSVNTKGADDANGSANKNWWHKKGAGAKYKKAPAHKKKKTNIDVVAHTCQEMQCWLYEGFF